MALFESEGSVFRLPRLDITREDASIIPSLPPITPQFSLPPLDEYAGAEERLLGSMSGRSWYGLMRDGELDVKGKGKALDVEGPPHPAGSVLETGVQDAAGNERKGYDDLYERAGEPSSPKKTFEPVKSWDLLDPHTGAGKAELLSESGPRIFEALLSCQEVTPMIPGLPEKVPTPSLKLDDVLRVLLQATLGTASSGSLKWISRDGRFKWDINGGRPAGMDRTAAGSSIKDVLEVASAFRRLEIILDSQSSEPLTPTHHALFHATSTYLTLLKQHLTETIRQQGEAGSCSWNRSCFSLGEIRELLKVLCEIMCWPLSDARPTGLPSRASSLLTHIYSHLIALHGTLPSPQSPPILCLAFILSKSSAPVLALLHQWVGLQDSRSIDTDPSLTSQPWADLGITRRPPKAGMTVSETGLEARWEYEFTPKRMPAFIPRELRRTLFEAGRSLRLLREASGGQHPLCAGKWALEGIWGWGGSGGRFERLGTGTELRRHTRYVQSAVEHWRRSVRDRSRPLSGSGSQPVLRTSRKIRKAIPSEFTSSGTMPMPFTASPEAYPTPVVPAAASLPSEEIAEDLEDDPMWSLFDQEPGSHLSTAPNGHLWTSNPLDELNSFLAFHSDTANPLFPLDSPTFPLYIKSHLLAPLLLHSDLVCTSLVSLYLDDLQVLDHFDILRAYWLGGDPGFTDRVSRALFGRDEAGAGEALGMGKRARTRARLGLGGGGDGMLKDENAEWGIGLGLGLSERAKWPPGGAELAYALRTTLLDDVNERRGEAWEGIQDRVSFAIKPLMEDEKDGRRARWLNPQAIEALDFLYLAYSAPSSVGELFPKALLEKYQHIHNFLLRLSRVHVVLNSLFYDVLHPTNADSEDTKVGVDARPRRPPSRSGTILHESKGILSIDKPLCTQTKVLRYRMTAFVDALSHYILDRAIGIHWDKMRSRLEKVRRKKHMASDNSRPGTPVQEAEEYWDIDGLPAPDNASDAGETEAGDDMDEDGGLLNINQLHSIHSIVTFHHLTLDRILRACLLSDHPGQQVVYKVLMTLFSLILDLGKAIKELEKRRANLESTHRKVERIEAEWDEKEAIFMHALERLSLRHQNRPEAEEKDPLADQQDLELLLRNEEVDGGGGRGRSGGNEDLQELLLRLNLRVGPVPRRGKYAPAAITSDL